MENDIKATAGANGQRAIEWALTMAESASSELNLSWDMDTGWAGDAYDNMTFETK